MRSRSSAAKIAWRAARIAASSARAASRSEPGLVIPLEFGELGTSPGKTDHSILEGRRRGTAPVLRGRGAVPFLRRTRSARARRRSRAKTHNCNRKPRFAEQKDDFSILRYGAPFADVPRTQLMRCALFA